MPDNHVLLSLLVITMLAALVPLLAARLKRFHIPVVILEILAGILIGKSVLGTVILVGSPDSIRETATLLGRE